MTAHIIQMQPTLIEGTTTMKLSKVGNQTNSQDPQAVNSRVFVGNLNTFQCSKTDVERMFQRYGRIAGISMHKGYAFVQFTNPFDARSACLGEDGRTVLGQILDVNMVAEPKPHQTGRKRQNLTKTGNDWDYYYDSYYAAAVAPRLVPPLKRPRLMVSQQSRSGSKNVTTTTTTTSPQKTQSNSTSSTATIVTATSTDQIKIYSNPDILICGNCREMFTELQELLDHKKAYCKLRFTCKCNTINGVKPSSNRKDAAALLCVQCKDSFISAWDLMVHVQAAHMINIYELGVPKCSNGTQHSSPSTSPNHKNDLYDDTLNHDDDIRLESPGSEDKNKENDLDQLTDAMDLEASESCGNHAISLNHSDTNSTGSIPNSLLKPLNGEATESE